MSADWRTEGTGQQDQENKEFCDLCPTLIEKVGTKVTILSLIFRYGFKTGSWNFTLLYTSQDNTSV